MALIAYLARSHIPLAGDTAVIYSSPFPRHVSNPRWELTQLRGAHISARPVRRGTSLASAPVAKAAVAGFDAVLIDPLLSVLFASHHLGGNRPPFSTVLAFVLIVPAARHARQTRADCNVACPYPGLARAGAATGCNDR
jgi:hypothetical protein